jgi:hypothetical protein
MSQGMQVASISWKKERKEFFPSLQKESALPTT